MDDTNIKIMILLTELLKGKPFVLVTENGLIGNVVPEEVSKMLNQLMAEADAMVKKTEAGQKVPDDAVRH